MQISAGTLYRKVVEDLSEGPTDEVSAMRGEMLCRALLKKLEPTRASARHSLRDAAYKKFLAVNRRMEGTYPVHHEDPLVGLAIGEGRNLLRSFFPDTQFYEPDPRNGSFGPGAVSGEAGTDPYSKGAVWSYSDTQHLAFFLRGPYVDLSELTAVRRRVAAATRTTSRITTVPKTVDIDRVIMIEPSLNMFVQQAIRYDLEAILCKLGIRLSHQQEINKALAQRASRDDSLSTLDLESASDSISLSFAESYLPPDLLWWCKSVRAESVEIGSEIYALNMLSTMGNATTFPLQTLIFATLVMGTYRALGIKPCSSGFLTRNWGVFGDDIIVDRRAYDLLFKVLVCCGFVPNPEKSFKQGLFRESCGGDYFDGYPVRGVYIKRLKTPQDMCSAYNRLHRWSIHYNVRLDKTLRYLRRCSGSPFVPVWAPDTAGLQTTEGVGSYYAWVERKCRVKYTDYEPDLALLAILLGCVETCDEDRIVLPVRGETRYRKVCLRAHSWRNPLPHVTSFRLPDEVGVPYSHLWGGAAVRGVVPRH